MLSMKFVCSDHLLGGLYREVVSVQRYSKSAFGTQPSGPYREVVSVQRSKSIAKEQGYL